MSSACCVVRLAAPTSDDRCRSCAAASIELPARHFVGRGAEAVQDEHLVERGRRRRQSRAATGGLAAREEAARERGDRREARACAGEAIGGAAAPARRATRGRRSPTATARSDPSARRADRAAARRPDSPRASAAARAGRRCTRPRASARSTASATPPGSDADRSGCRSTGGVIGSRVSSGDGQPGRASDGRVRVVFGGGRRDDHVVAVVAAGQEHADQRPVVGALREGVDQAEPLDAGGKRCGAERIAEARLTGLQQEFSTCDRAWLSLHLILR